MARWVPSENEREKMNDRNQESNNLFSSFFGLGKVFEAVLKGLMCDTGYVECSRWASELVEQGDCQKKAK